MGKQIEIENIGPIRELRMALPERGGVVVLQGRNGLGKSTAIEAVGAAIRGEGALDVRRGSARGTVDACGVAIRVSRNTRRSGELEVDTLEGKLSVAELVDPGVKEEAAADRVRVRALLHVIQYDASDCGPKFRALLPADDFDRIVTADSLATKDPVELARRIKKCLDDEALRVEREAEGLSARAKGLEDAAHGTPPPAGSDEELAAALSAATLALDRAEQHDAAVAKALTAREEAVATLTAWETASAGKLTAEAANAAHAEAEVRLRAANDRVEELRKLLRDAEAAKQLAEVELTNAAAVASEAMTRERAIAKFREAAAVPVLDPTPPETMEALRKAKADAATAVADGGVRRKAQEEREAAAELRRQASDKSEWALKLRDAAKATDDVLTDMVAACGVALSINQGRLVYRDDTGERLFHELSMGEKYRVALDIAIQAINRLFGQDSDRRGEIGRAHV